MIPVYTMKDRIRNNTVNNNNLKQLKKSQKTLTNNKILFNI